MLNQFKYYYWSDLRQNATGICIFISFSLIPFNKIYTNKLRDLLPPSNYLLYI